ncbi:unnamed protein product [Rodentolepis nana]|uniref:ANK_REP_REGION domain-containing protein n=1 Tax=Rodentolepis nana TaxID=102285 RepID=A0A0R3TK42_RODNA|nr:unnamed protein product [Rodentolepis nana]
MVYGRDPRLRRKEEEQLTFNVLSNSQTENQPQALLNELKVRTDVESIDCSSTPDAVTPSTGCSLTPTVLNGPTDSDLSVTTKDVPTEVLLLNACTIGDCDEVVRILALPEPPNVSQKYLYFAAKGGMKCLFIHLS